MSVSSVFAIVLVLLGIGALLARLRAVPESAPEALNAVAIHVCMPASILLHVPKLTPSREVLAIALVPWSVLAGTVVVLVPLARLLRLDRPSRACLLLCGPLGNTAFLGYVLVPALGGQGALPYAVVYDQLGSFLILATYGVFVIAAMSGGARPTPALVIRRVVTFTPFVALLLALTVVPAELPAEVTAGLSLTAGAFLPTVALALGMQLRPRVPRRHLAPLGALLATKLVLAPAVALGAATVLGLGSDARAAVVYQSGMPTMMTTAALLTAARLAPELAAAAVAYTTLASMGTLALWRAIL